MDAVEMPAKVAVLCWEENRPWVSALRQNGYSVPWVEEPKADLYRQIPSADPDVVIFDLTRTPDKVREMMVELSGKAGLKNVPFIAVAEKSSASRGLKSKVDGLIVTTPKKIVATVKSALAAAH
jgi:AmiR/NasT family two-component response regulator